MTREHKRWTSEEDEILKENVVKYGLVKGSKATAALLDRTVSGCMLRTNKLKNEGFVYEDSRIGTHEETLNTIKECVMENPGNLTAAFKRASERTGLRASTISQSWYSKKGKMSRDNLGICFCTISQKLSMQNRKNCISSKRTKHTGIIRWIKSVLKLH